MIEYTFSERTVKDRPFSLACKAAKIILQERYDSNHPLVIKAKPQTVSSMHTLERINEFTDYIVADTIARNGLETQNVYDN